VHIEVRDLRNAAEREQRSDSPLSGVDSGLSLRKAAAEGETELVVELRGGNRDMASAENFREVRDSRHVPSFENLLARELNQSLSGDIVRHAQAVLRDGNAGTIKLTLRPETLGSVKIRLEMAENKITGHIIVESEEALRAFEREIHSLEQAFRDAGFETADLEMSLNQGGGSEQRREREEAIPLVSAGLAASRYAREQEEALTTGGRGFYVSGGQVTVNMLI
jgi:flagellar hook-length control protein FliK